MYLYQILRRNLQITYDELFNFSILLLLVMNQLGVLSTAIQQKIVGTGINRLVTPETFTITPKYLCRCMYYSM